MFVGAKVSVQDVATLTHLQKQGFYVIDTNIQLSASGKIHHAEKTLVRFAEPDDENEVRSMARCSFAHNRFHRDPEISDFVASKIKEEWAGNYFSGNRGKWMIVAEEQGAVQGFLQLLKRDEQTIIIDLVAVAQESRGRGLAKAMISYSTQACLESPGEIQTGTQIANTASLGLYLSLGFRIISASYVLHLHVKG